MYSANEWKLLVKATARIYGRSFVDAFHGVRLNWWMPFLHIGYLFAVGVVTFVALFFGRMLGGFIVGFFLCAVVASYLSTVSSAVNKERFLLKEMWNDMVGLFSSVLWVLFCFYILEYLADIAFRGNDVAIVRMGLNLLIAVLFNAIPEAIYVGRAYGMESFQESVEFVFENVVEWFFPVVAVLLALLLFVPGLSIGPFMVLVSVNPLQLMESAFMFSGLALRPHQLLISGGWLVVFLFLMYYIFAFRGVLYRELARSTRRKRIYQERAL